MRLYHFRRWIHPANRALVRLCPNRKFLQTAEEVGAAMMANIYGVEIPPLLCTFTEPKCNAVVYRGRLGIAVPYFDNRLYHANLMGCTMAWWAESKLQPSPNDNMPHWFVGEWIGNAILAAAHDPELVLARLASISTFEGIEIEKEPLPAQGLLAFVAWFLREQQMPYPMARKDLLQAWNEVQHMKIARDQYLVLIQAANPRVLEWLYSANSDRRAPR